jgi:glutathione S-transferase
VPYPNAYATETQLKEKPAEAYAFNCAQRAHANFTEHHLSAVAAMLVAGLEYPVAAAAMGAGWTLSRALYMTGYTSGTPESKGSGRYRGSAFWLFELGLIGTAAWVGIKMVMGN